MCDKNNISAYHISSKYAVFDNLTTCKINGIKYTKPSDSNINIQIINNSNININKDVNYVLVANGIFGNHIHLPSLKNNHSIKIRNDTVGNIIVIGQFYNNTNYVLNSNSTNEFIYYANNNNWIVF